MKNPLKAIKKSFKNLLGGKTPKGRPDLDSPNYRELWTIWPDGSWQMPGTRKESQADYDNTIRGVLLDLWAYKGFYDAQESAGYELNPGHFHSAVESVPPGWRPSERHLKLLWAKKNYDVKILHYIVAELENRRMLTT